MTIPFTGEDVVEVAGLDEEEEDEEEEEEEGGLNFELGVAFVVVFSLLFVLFTAFGGKEFVGGTEEGWGGEGGRETDSGAEGRVEGGVGGRREEEGVVGEEEEVEPGLGVGVVSFFVSCLFGCVCFFVFCCFAFVS